MKQSELIALLGLPSTDLKMVDFFERYQIGKLPKSITPNQRSKSILYKPMNISFWFEYDIKNNKFQPPLSPRGDDYKFVAYLAGIMFSHVDDSVKTPDPKSPDFWDVTPSPLHSFQNMENLMGKPTEDGDHETIFEWLIDEDKKLTVRYTKDKKNNLMVSSRISIIQQREIINRAFFNEAYHAEDFPFIRRAHTCIIKWLFDRKFLLLDVNGYQTKLKAETTALLDFVQSHLKGHLWANQIIAEKGLRSFLYVVTTNKNIKDEQGNKIPFYIRDIILDCMGKKREFEILYDRDFGKIYDFLNELVFDSQVYEAVATALTAKFEVHKKLNYNS